MAVVKTPDSIPAANSCGYLTHTQRNHTHAWHLCSHNYALNSEMMTYDKISQKYDSHNYDLLSHNFNFLIACMILLRGRNGLSYADHDLIICSGSRQNVVWCFLLQFLSKSEAEEADGEHGRDSDDGCRHALIEPAQTLRDRQRDRQASPSGCLQRSHK